jgi:DNA-binding PadR family transcriptional regulator
MQVASGQDELTELEGAVLTEIGHRGNCTAFRVRRAFQLSGSANWRGSAGAVYAAIRRLADRGLLEAQPIAGKRGGNLLGLTARGKDALTAWLMDLGRAADAGFDPFRLRAGLWIGLPATVRSRHKTALKAAVEDEIERLRRYGEGQDVVERTEIDLAIRLQELRLAWIEEALA